MGRSGLPPRRVGQRRPASSFSPAGTWRPPPRRARRRRPPPVLGCGGLPLRHVGRRLPPPPPMLGHGSLPHGVWGGAGLSRRVWGGVGLLPCWDTVASPAACGVAPASSSSRADGAPRIAWSSSDFPPGRFDERERKVRENDRVVGSAHGRIKVRDKGDKVAEQLDPLCGAALVL
jgi:hypothetical protein